jgi:hypothetical protein
MVKGTSGTFGRDGCALVLTEGDKKVVDNEPVLLRQFFSQCEFRLFRSSGLHVTPPVADAVNMRIRTDPRFAETKCNHQIRRLPTHALELQKFIDIVRDSTLA